MSDLNTIIDAFNARYNMYQEKLKEAGEAGDKVAAAMISNAIKELSWCITEVQSAGRGGFRIDEKFDLFKVFKFGKHKGKSVKQIIDDNQDGYLDWCLENIQGFELDESVYEYWTDETRKVGGVRIKTSE